MRVSSSAPAEGAKAYRISYQGFHSSEPSSVPPTGTKIITSDTSVTKELSILGQQVFFSFYGPPKCRTEIMLTLL